MTEPFDGAFRDRSVFVTGHTGFKGSWLCLWLESLGARVTGYALDPPTDPANFEISGVVDGLARHHIADVRDADTLRAALDEAQPDVIIHLAAQSAVRESYRIPRETFDVNVLGIASLLDCVREVGRACAIVAVTSDKCYRNVEQVWGYCESDEMGDLSPYGGSKGAAELLIRSYRHSFFHPARLDEHGVKLASARAGNVIGGGDWTTDALVVDIVRGLAAGRPVEIRNPAAFRPWQHVLQALSGYLTLALHLMRSDDPSLAGGWNIGPLPGNELPVQDLVERFLAGWGEGTWRDVSDSANPHEADVLRLNIDKALWKLGWRPAWNIDEVLRHTIHWYRRYFDAPETLRDLSIDQISTYEAAMLGKDGA